MDLSRFSIDAALFSGAGASNAYRSVFYERLLSSLFEKDENLFVKTDIRKEREQIFVFPALYWLSTANRVAERGKALYLCHDEEAAAAVCDAAALMTAGMERPAKPVLLTSANADSDEVRDASLLVTSIQTFSDLLPTGTFKPREYGLVIADQAELLAELPGEFMRKIQGSLLPSWERKSLIIANRHTPRAKSFAWDFSDNPREMKLGETMGSAGTTAAVSRKMDDADKIRYLLKLLLEGDKHRLCVFCNLKSSAAELSARLVLNGAASDYIAGNLNPDRKNQIVTKALTWNGKKMEASAAEPEADALSEADALPEAAPAAKASRFPADSFILVLTDDGAKGLNRPEFSIVVNYDIPLEPEFYFERLNFLKKQDSGTMLYNLVCERYMYGIPAIERAIDASLSLAALEASAELPQDLSAGQRIEMPEPRFRGRDGRHGRDDRHDRDDRRRSDDRHGRDERHDTRYNASPEARRLERPERAMQERPIQERPIADRPRQDRPVVANPYAMSMEERLALYKKKYARNLGKAPAAENQSRSPRPRPQEQKAQKQKPATQIPAQQIAPAARPLDVRPLKVGQPEVDQSEAGEKNRGIFSRLQDLFGSHKE